MNKILVAPSVECARKLATALNPGKSVSIFPVDECDMVDVRIFLDGLRNDRKAKKGQFFGTTGWRKSARN